MIKIIHDIITNEITEVPLTADEIKERENYAKAVKAEMAACQAEADLKAAQRQAIADRLGLSADELKLLLG